MHLKMQVKRGRIIDTPRTISSSMLILFLSWIICDIHGTLASNGNSGSIDEDTSSMDMMGRDPNLLIIPNKEGYGQHIPINEPGSSKNNGKNFYSTKINYRL